MMKPAEEKTMRSGQKLGRWVVRELDRQFHITPDEALRVSPNSNGLEDLFRDLRGIPPEEFQQRVERIRNPEIAEQEAEDAGSGDAASGDTRSGARAEPGFGTATGPDPAAKPAASGGGAARGSGPGEQGGEASAEAGADPADKDADTGGAGRTGGGSAERGRVAAADVRHDSGGGRPGNGA